MPVFRHVALAMALAAAAPQVPAAQKMDGRTLLATVVDRTGRTQVDFGVDDFVITENGQERDVLDVHIADYPIALLLDDADPASVPSISSAVSRFVTRIGERPMSLGTLSRPETMIATFDDTRTDVLAKLAQLSAAGVSDAGLTLASVANAARMLGETGAPFSAIVVVSARIIDATGTVQGDLLPSILGSGASVHVISGRLPGPESVVAADAPDLLRVLADESRGQYTAVFSLASYGVALDRLADRLTGEMMVEYLVPANSTAGDVRAGVRRPGARVLGLGVK